MLYLLCSCQNSKVLSRLWLDYLNLSSDIILIYYVRDLERYTIIMINMLLWPGIMSNTLDWNAPQRVENVHTLCAGMPESDDRDNDNYISVKRCERVCGPAWKALYKNELL